MAITWTVDITNVDIVNKRGDFRATRTDSTGGTSRSYTLQYAPMANNSEKLAILNAVKTLDEEAVVIAGNIEVFLDGQESAAEAWLNNWEATR